MFENLKIGILGGGQLGAMLLRYAIDFELNVSVMDKNQDAPCSRHTSSFKLGDPANYEEVISFGEGLDIITIEKESVNVTALKRLRNKGVKVYPSPEIIEIIQDKYVQKQYLFKHSIPAVPGWLVQGQDDLEQHIKKFPAVLKKCRNGNDGNGVMILTSAADIEHAFDEPCVLEQTIDIKHEISLIVSRNEGGLVECYDPVLMVFNKERMILDFQICPENIDVDTAIKACNIAIKTAESLKLTGIMVVEIFVAKDGKIYVNKLASRQHNSGHHTIEACAMSQFEQQIRLILGLPMGTTKLNKTSEMINILEPVAYRKNIITEALKTILCTNDVNLHWHSKAAGKEGRKMGHVTVRAENIENVMSKAIMIRHLVRNEYETV
jgi:5-(carboxyamino)imidazole ribonucleotide synthase